MTIASVILAPALVRPQGTAFSGYVPNAVSDYLLYTTGVGGSRKNQKKT